MDSENPRDNNWRCLWERPSKKLHLQHASLCRLSSDPSLMAESIVPAHPVHEIQSLWPAIQQISIWKTSSFASVRIWRQSRRNRLDIWMNYKSMLTICSRKMTALGLFGRRIKNARGSNHPTPPVKQNKGKQPIQPNDSDAAADDEFSSGSYLLPDLPPPKDNVEA